MLVYRLRLLPVIWHPTEGLSGTFDKGAEVENLQKVRKSHCFSNIFSSINELCNELFTIKNNLRTISNCVVLYNVFSNRKPLCLFKPNGTVSHNKFEISIGFDLEIITVNYEVKNIASYNHVFFCSSANLILPLKFFNLDLHITRNLYSFQETRDEYLTRYHSYTYFIK